MERALELSKADECIVIGRHHCSANVRWANNTTTTNGVTDSGRLSSSPSSTDAWARSAAATSRSEALEEVVRESEAACEGKPPAEDLMPLLPGEGFPDDLDGDPPPTGIEVFEKVVPNLAAAFRRAEEGGYLLFGYAEHELSTVFLATSTGLRHRHQDPRASSRSTPRPPTSRRPPGPGG